MIWKIRLERKERFFEIKTYSIRFNMLSLVQEVSSRWPTSIQMRRALRRWMRIFYNIVSLWYMVSRLHTISSKILYGRKNYNTIEKKILYGKNFFTITIRNNNCKNFLPYYHTIFIAAISCRPLVLSHTFHIPKIWQKIENK